MITPLLSRISFSALSTLNSESRKVKRLLPEKELNSTSNSIKQLDANLLAISLLIVQDKNSLHILIGFLFCFKICINAKLSNGIKQHVIDRSIIES